MRLIHTARARAVISVGLLALAVIGCGTLEVGIAPTPGTAPPVSAVETRAVTPATPEITVGARTATPTRPAQLRTPVPAPAALRVAFSKENNVWLWVEGEDAVQLTRRGGVDQIKLSDDGAVVAFTRGGELWVVRADGTDERPLVSIDDLEAIRLAMSLRGEVLLSSFEWAPGTHVVAYNTRVDVEVGLVHNDDLRTADADSGEQVLLLAPGDGGGFYYSPDGRRIAVVTPGSISVVESDGSNRVALFTYTPVATASEFQYYAMPVWSPDSAFLRVVIPPANPYANPPQPATVWHLPADGSGPSLLSDIDLAASSRPAFSPDLRYVAHQFAQPSGSGEHITSLLITDLDLRGTTTYYPGTDAGFQITLESGEVITEHPQIGEIYGWATGGKHLAFGALMDPELPFQAQIGELGGAVEPAAPSAEGAVIDLSWVDAGRYLFVAQSARGWNILLGSVDGPYVTVAGIGGSGLPPSYDFAAPEAEPSGPDDGARGDGDLPAGLVYQTPEGIWLVDSSGKPQLISDRGDGVVSSDGSRMLYAEGDDIWIIDLASGEPINVTGTPDRIECCPRWWPSQAETILFNSWTPEEAGPSYGFATIAQLDGAGYTVLDDSEVSYSLPAPSPDGRTVAYDRAGKAWLYVRDTGRELFDPSAFGLPIAYGSPGESQWRVVSPSWSPDGTHLAWIVADCREGACETSVGIFDLVEQTAQLLHPHTPAGRGGQPPAAPWSPDGQWLAFNSWAEDPEEAGLWVIRADGQEEHALATGDARPDPTPVWSPDGRWLAFSATSANGQSRTFWLAVAGRWDRTSFDLPPDARLAAWVGSQL